MAWCCPKFTEHVEQAGKDGFGIYYSYREPPHNPGVKLFRLLYRKREGVEQSSNGSVQIRHCPWCGI